MNVPLIKSTEGLISRKLLKEYTKQGLVLVNTSRAGLVDEQNILDAIEEGTMSGYLTDVLDSEPMVNSCLLKNKQGVLITPHIGSRTTETIQRQGSLAVNNLISMTC